MYETLQDQIADWVKTKEGRDKIRDWANENLSCFVDEEEARSRAIIFMLLDRIEELDRPEK